MGVSQLCRDDLRQAGVLEVLHRLPVAFFVDFDGRQAAAGPAERPCHPDRRSPRGCADLERPRVLLLEDEIVKGQAVGFGHVHVAPAVPVPVQETGHLRVERRLVPWWLRAQHGSGDEDERADVESSHRAFSPRPRFRRD